MPRKYSMERRSATVDETRQRIVDATVELHNEKGVTATTMQDIASRASVSLATVYRHFPTLEDLVPACGGRNLELNPPPTASAFEHLDGEERIGALVAALYEHYERGERPYEVGLEAVGLPVMANLMSELAGYLTGLVGDAIAPFDPSQRQRNLVTGLCDFRVWRALTQSGLSNREAIESMTRLVSGVLTEVTGLQTGGEQ